MDTGVVEICLFFSIVNGKFFQKFEEINSIFSHWIYVSWLETGWETNGKSQNSQ